MNEHTTYLAKNQKELLTFLKSKYHLYHLSNVFFRDLHFGLMAYFEMSKMKVSYSDAEEITRSMIKSWEDAKILRGVGNLAWVLQYPDFKKPAVKPAPPAKTATPAKPAVATVAKPTEPEGTQPTQTATQET